MSTPTHTHPALSATAYNPPDGVRFTVPYLVRVTPELDQLVRQAATAEDQRLGEFVRAAIIHRLGDLGLVPVLGDVDEDET